MTAFLSCDVLYGLSCCLEAGSDPVIDKTDVQDIKAKVYGHDKCVVEY